MQRLRLDEYDGMPLCPPAREALLDSMEGPQAQSRGFHQSALAARQSLEEARQSLAHSLGAALPEEILFTGNGTEAVNLALRGAALAMGRHARHLVSTRLEHPAVEETLKALEKDGFEVTRVGNDPEGRVDPNDLRAALREDTFLVCHHAANPDTGRLTDLEQLMEVLAPTRIPVFLDATYGAGWMPLDLDRHGIALAALSPARFGGPRGIGILYRRRGARVRRILTGGDQEQGLRPGGEWVGGAVAAAAAAKWARETLPAAATPMREAQQAFLEQLSHGLKDWVLNGPPVGPDRHPGHLSVSLACVEGEAVALRCDLRGLEIASGAACQVGDLKVPPVLRELGRDPLLAAGTLRITFGPGISPESMRWAADQIAEAARTLRAQAPQ